MARVEIDLPERFLFETEIPLRVAQGVSMQAAFRAVVEIP